LALSVRYSLSGSTTNRLPLSVSTDIDMRNLFSLKVCVEHFGHGR
jgi:hypothetical protein